MIMASFTTRVFTRSYAETIHIFEIAANIPTMSGSLPEGAWTNDNNDNKGYLVRGIMDSFVFCNDDLSKSIIVITQPVTNNNDGTYSTTTAEGANIIFTITNDVLVSVAVSGLTGDYYILNGTYSAPVSGPKVNDIFYVDGIKYIVTAVGETNTVKVTKKPENPVYSGNIVIPEKVTNNQNEFIVTELASNTFANTSVTSVKLPKTITKIGKYAFNNCQSLTTLICGSDIPPTLGSDVFEECQDNLKIQVPITFYENYINEDSDISKGWYAYKDKIDAYVTVDDLLIDFPNSRVKGWVNENGAKAYINGDNLSVSTSIPLNSILQKDGDNF